MGDWTFFSNHGHVLVCLARDSDARLRDVAVQVGITERAVQKIVRDLQDEGYLEISKRGRRNRYRINNRKALRHSLQAGCTVGQLMNLLSKADSGKTASKKVPSTPEELVHQAKPLVRPDTRIDNQIESRPEKMATDSSRDEGEPRQDKPEPKSAQPQDAADKPADSELEQGQLF